MKDIQPIIESKARDQKMDLRELGKLLHNNYDIQVDYWSLCFLLQHPHKITDSCAQAISTILHLNEKERRTIFLRYPK